MGQILDYLGGAIAVAGMMYLPIHNHHSPLYPWDNAGSSAYVLVINERRDSIEVFAEAPEVDNERRCVGVVAPGSSKVFKIPYADTKVKIILGNITYILEVKKPFLWRLILEKELQ